MTSDTGKKYFNQIITGSGYLNHIREVQPKKGESFLACYIAGLNGPSDKPDKVRYDVKVSGSDAQHLIRKCIDAVNKRKDKVFIGYRLGDPWIDQFEYPKGHKDEGKPGASFKARLLYISFIDINGERMYEAESRASDEEAADHESAESSEPSSASTQSQDPEAMAA